MTEREYGPGRLEYQQAIIRGDLPFPDDKEPEPPCCTPNALGECVDTCPRAYPNGPPRRRRILEF